MNFKKKFEIKKTFYKSAKSYKTNQLKSCYYFTDRKKNPNLNQVLKNLPRNSSIIFREYDLPNQDREKMAKEYFKLAKKLKHQFIVGKDFKLAIKIKAHGVHFSDKDLSKSLFLMRFLCRKNNLLFSLAIHRANQLFLLKKYRPNISFISPIFLSSSHVNQKPLGFFNFYKIQKIYLQKINIFKYNNLLPLGGINLQNLSRLNNINLSGFGAIDYFKNL